MVHSVMVLYYLNQAMKNPSNGNRKIPPASSRRVVSGATVVLLLDTVEAVVTELESLTVAENKQVACECIL